GRRRTRHLARHPLPPDAPPRLREARLQAQRSRLALVTRVAAWSREAAAQPAAIRLTTSGSAVGRPLARSIQTITTWPSAYTMLPSSLAMRWPRVTLVLPTRLPDSSTTTRAGYGIGTR